jgi:hypothetical protein
MSSKDESDYHPSRTYIEDRAENKDKVSSADREAAAGGDGGVDQHYDFGDDFHHDSDVGVDLSSGEHGYVYESLMAKQRAQEIQCIPSWPQGPPRSLWSWLRTVVTSDVRRSRSASAGAATGEGMAEASVPNASAARVAIFIKANMVSSKGSWL